MLADAWLPDLVRLGELKAHLRDGVIEGLGAAGRLPQRPRRRIMSYALVIRLMIAMTLMPDASYCEAPSRLAGLLADVGFTRDWHVPTGEGDHGMAAAGPAVPGGGPVLAGRRAAGRR